MSRPKNPSYTVPTVRRGSRPEDEVPPLAASPRTSTGFLSNAFIRRMTVKSAATNSTFSEPDHFPHRRRLSFSDKFWEGTGPNGLICVHNPEEPLVDLVFVHGLHGGSFKTWRKREEKGYFWPGEWLANDSEFQNVRIHTFGYPADWNDFKASNASVLDFGSSLYGALISSTHLMRGNKTPLILVGHSMGGLVIKRACLLAYRQRGNDAVREEDDDSLASRIKCLMFLGTPHHGSDSAERLDRILRAGANPMSQKDYVRDLRRESLSNETINDEFRFIADHFSLFSFFEARQTQHLGFVVDKDSAKIGGPRHEHTQSLDADHRNLVKFDDEDDPNYRTIHDHLLKMVDALIGIENEREPDKLDPLEVYLDCEESHDEIFETILERKVPGTCQWIKHREAFIPWTQGTGPPIWLYWLSAAPGTGKSVMSASVIRSLEDQSRDVSYFFFINGNKYHRSVAGLLRFMALQMANKHRAVEEAIREMQRTGIQWDEADEKVIWRKLFVNCIFKLPLKRTQYWVIDALDESSDSAKLWPLFKSFHAKFALRVFLTSRPSAVIRTSFDQLGNAVKRTEDSISPEDTQSDIRRLLDDRRSTIPGNDGENGTEMLDKIVQRSQGSFLWTNLVLKEMESAYSETDIEGILAEVPSEMVEHYESIFKQMSAKHARNKPLIQAMLTWATCCVRPLTQDEFQRALHLDTGVSIAVSMQRTVEGLCGQVLTINKHGAVQVVHSTVQEMLFDKSQKIEYSIRREEGHKRLALACLTYLNSPEMRPDARLHLLTETKLGNSIVQRASPFADYAATAFSIHLVNSPVDNEQVFKQLVKFLQSPNALSWMDYVAQKHNSLVHVKEAGTNLKRFMQKRAKVLPPFGPGVDLVTSWSIDLLRVVAKFGRNILDAPSQIILLVPAMCPRNSIIHQQYSNRNPGFQVLGIAEDFWADAISYIEHLGSKPSAISMGARYFGVGRESGQIHIYNNETWEELLNFSHGEPIRALKFSNSGNYLVASGTKTLKLWDLEDATDPKLTPEPIWSGEVPHPSLSFFFSDDDETLVTISGNSILSIKIEDDEDDEEAVDDEDGENGGLKTRIQPLSNGAEAIGAGTAIYSVTFSPDGGFVAFTHGDEPISIWDVETGTHLGLCTRLAGTHTSDDRVEKLIFNPNPEFGFLVATYRKGELALIDYNQLREVKVIKAETTALACTPDGHTLATGDGTGKIKLWDSENLALLYIINYHSSAVRDVRFSKDGLKLVDLRETHSVIWEPAALIRSNDEEDSSSVSGTSVSYRPPAIVDDYDDKVQISSFTVHPSKPVAVVGKDNGSVDLYSMETGERTGELFSLQAGRVTHLALNKNSLLACACSERTVSVALLADDEAGLIRRENVLLSVDDFGERIVQLVFSDSGNSLLVCGAKRTQVWRRSAGTSNFKLLAPSASPEGDCWRYLPCPDDADSFQLFDKKIDDLVRVADDGVPRKLRRINTVESEKDTSPRIRNVLIDSDSGYLIIEYEGALATRQLVILQRLSGLTAPEPNMLHAPADPAVEPASPPPMTDNYRVLLHLKSYQIKMFLGLHGGRAVYLGPRLWVRTCDLRHLVWGQKPVKRRHFFVPHEYIGGSYHVQAIVSPQGEVVFPRRGELAVVRGGLTS